MNVKALTKCKKKENEGLIVAFFSVPYANLEYKLTTMTSEFVITEDSKEWYCTGKPFPLSRKEKDNVYHFQRGRGKGIKTRYRICLI